MLSVARGTTVTYCLHHYQEKTEGNRIRRERLLIKKEEEINNTGRGEELCLEQ